MAVYDLRQRRLCVRVVYDGPAGAGKTTNVQQLAELFAPQASAAKPRWDHHHQDLFGRTLTFDWEQLNAGVAGGLPLQCQIVSVPGQHALEPRRRALLAGADVIVYVCDGAAEALGQTRAGLSLIETIATERGKSVPLVLQVNKQDGASAISPAETARLLGLPEHTAVGAVAVQGKGVMDTFIAAVRAVGQALATAIEAGTVRVPIRAAERPDTLVETLESLPLDAEDAAEMLLEELLDRFGENETVRFAPPRVEAPIAPPSLPLDRPPAGFVWPPIAGREILGELGPQLTSPRPPLTFPAGNPSLRVQLGSWSATTSRAHRFAEEEPARIALAALARSLPPNETDDVDVLIVLSVAVDGGAWLWILERTSAAQPVAAAAT